MTAFGDPKIGVRRERLTYDAPQAGQVLVRVLTAGAGLPDAMMAAGAYPLVGDPPFGLGEEVAGEVVEVADGSKFSVGDRIMGITAFLAGWGGYADYTYVVEQSAVVIPEALSDEQAGGFPIAYRTAFAGLVERSNVQAGETLVVLGGGGSSGLAAIQMGKAYGARVIAVAGSAEKLSLASAAGADAVINYRSVDLAEELLARTDGRGVDLIFDVVGGSTAAAAVKALGRDGRIAMVGLASGAPVVLDSLDMILRNYTAVGVLAVATPEADAIAWARLVELVEAGYLSTQVGRVWSLDDVPAMITQQTAPVPGKSVVRVAAPSIPIQP
ncbi:zinc-binding dehydrogenase [Actinoplanes sp. NPDC049596]|uniref:zinc-binding dehydrogenase n=1 Tax=unclassified Actinoplanes TaxID=2626549 RepID=UPI003423FAF2